MIESKRREVGGMRLPSIRRGLVLILVTAGVVSLAPFEARAGGHEVTADAADVLVAAAWEPSTCDVRVLRRSGDVELVCVEGGFASVMLKIRLPGIRTLEAVRAVRLDDSGSTDNCGGETPLRLRVRNDWLRLIVSRSYEDVGSFDCWYRSVLVRYRSGA